MSKKLPAIIELSPAQLAQAQGGAARPTLADRTSQAVTFQFDSVSPFARRPPGDPGIAGGLVTIKLPDLSGVDTAVRAAVARTPI